MWQKVLALLKQDIVPGDFELFIKPLTVTQNDEKYVYIQCKSVTHKTKVEKSFQPLIEKRVEEIIGKKLTLKLDVSSYDENSKSSRKKKEKDYIDLSVNLQNEHSILESVLSEKFDFRRDSISGVLEYKRKPENHFRRFAGEITFNDIYRELLTTPKLKTVKTETLRISLNSSFVSTYNPLLDYIRSLKGKWKKGDPNFLGQMINCFKFTNKINVEYYFKKWYMQVLHSAFVPEFVNEYCFLFQSTRGGKGKTIFCKNFLPEFINNRFRNFGQFCDFKSKDSLILASQVLVWVMDEYEGIARNRYEADQLRGFISNTGAMARKAYGKENEHYKRLASFMGTCNVEEPLWDTENRRYIVVTIEEKMDFDKFFEINKELVLAQVYNEYLQLRGNGILLTGKEELEIINNARQYERNNSEYDILPKHFEPVGNESESAKWLTATEILEFLNTYHPNSYFNINGIGRSLMKAGFSKNRNNTYKTYLVGFKSEESQEFFKADKADKADFSKLNSKGEKK